MVSQIANHLVQKPAKGKLTHAVRDEYGLIQVIDTTTTRSLYFNTPVEQSRLYFDAPMTLGFEYQQQIIKLISNHISRHKVNSTLSLGLGGGSLLNHLYCLLPNAKHFAVELRQNVIDIAYEFFFLTDRSSIQTINEDAAAFIEYCDQFDLLIVDLYDQESMPVIFCGTEFLTSLMTKKKKSGLVLFNLWTSTPNKTLKVLQFWQKQTGLNIHIEHTVSSGNIILSIQ